MNPGGAAEEGVKVAGGIVEALKSQPALLAMMVANFALLGFMFYALNSAAAYRESMMKQVFDNSTKIHELLQHRAIGCPDPPGPARP
jgi:hypothetical protein